MRTFFACGALMAAVLPLLRCGGAQHGEAGIPASDAVMASDGGRDSPAAARRRPGAAMDAGALDETPALEVLRSDVRKLASNGNLRVSESAFEPALERAAYRISAGAADLEIARGTLAEMVRKLAATEKGAKKDHSAEEVEDLVQGRCATYWPFC